MHTENTVLRVLGGVAVAASLWACSSADSGVRDRPDGEDVTSPEVDSSVDDVADDTRPSPPDADAADGGADAEGDVRPAACGDRECGLLPDGTACGTCWLTKGGLIATYCNEASGHCQQLNPSCADGWCLVPAGSFQGGWPTVGGGQLPYYESPPHEIVLTRSYRIQQTEVTQGQWLELMASNPSPFPACGLDCPVSEVTFFDTLEYANRLSQRDGWPVCYDLTGCVTLEGQDHGRECESAVAVGPDCQGYRLPSEDEWEHAAKAGTPYCLPGGPIGEGQTDCVFNAEYAAQAWYCGNSAVMYEGCLDLSTMGGDASTCAGLHPAGLTTANRLGLRDMNGSVYEFTGSIWTEPGATNRAEDRGQDRIFTPTTRVAVRGGTYASLPSYVCSAFRTSWFTVRMVLGPTQRVFGMNGFRLVQTVTTHAGP